MKEFHPPAVVPFSKEGKKTLKPRLAAAQSAQKRTRLALLSVMLISFAMLTAGWNAHFSVYRDVAREFSDLVHTENSTPNSASSTVSSSSVNSVSNPKDLHTGVRVLQEEILRGFVANRMVSIPFLGIRVGADDAPLLGTLALSIAMIWFYLSVRRENYVISWLLYDGKSKDPDKESRLQIFHGIVSYSIFTRPWSDDRPFDEIIDPSKKQAAELPRMVAKIPGLKEVFVVIKKLLARLLQVVTKNIYYLPIVAVIGVLLLEGWALCTPSPFRLGNDSLLVTLWNDYRKDFFWRVGKDVFACLLALPVWGLCWKTSTFKKSTEEALEKFYSDFYPTHVVVESTPLSVEHDPLPVAEPNHALQRTEASREAASDLHA